MSLVGPEVTLQDLSKHWKETRALDALSLTLEAGKFTAILGPSGCGKSTLLRLLAGLEDPSGGDIFINGKSIVNTPPAKRGIAMVFQNYALFPHLSVAQNILFGLQVRRSSKAEQAEKLDHAAEMLGLRDHLAKRPSQLSGGQQQRVALARAIVGDRSVLLMDEPLSNLDAKLRAEMRLELRELQQRLGVTVVYVTHDQLEAVTMADRVLLLSNGRVSQYSAPRELYSHPENLFAATFVGTPQINLLPAQELLPQGSADLAGVSAGLRPESLRRVTKGGFEARVLSAEYHGSDTMVAADLKGHRLLIRMKAAESERLPETIRIDFDRTELHLFDQDTGQRRDALLHHFAA